jgi:hypothetical protein
MMQILSLSGDAPAVRWKEGFWVGLAKRGTRLLVVEGVTYRWVVSPDDGYMVLVAELSDTPGQRLKTTL